MLFEGGDNGIFFKVNPLAAGNDIITAGDPGVGVYILYMFSIFDNFNLFESQVYGAGNIPPLQHSFGGNGFHETAGFPGHIAAGPANRRADLFGLPSATRGAFFLKTAPLDPPKNF